ncbi:spore cortex biosynthesis protein YabQ [Sporosarcina gallistercoris]|uniref:spore cortex biosynthesis protein YabQ n=1 Tax=Sporosarcina gallistercoris TaxID=2762245 RepID=UPI003D27267F
MSISAQFVSLLAMVGTGIIAGAFMDMLGTGIANTGKTSIIRRRAIWFETVGWLLAGSFAFAVLFVFRDGAWRMYDPLAQVSGLLLYATVFHRPFRLLGRISIALLIRPVLLVFQIILWFLRYVFRLIRALILLLSQPFRFIYHRFFRNHFKKKSK